MQFRTSQVRFTQGELDPKMIGRNDVDQYYGAAALLRNVFTLPQGGFRRRPGLEFIDQVLGQLTLRTPTTATAPNGGTAANAYDNNRSNVLTTTTSIGTTTPYVVVSYDLGSTYSIGVVYIYGLSLSASSSNKFYIQGSTDGTTWQNCGAALSLTTTSKDYSRRVYKSYRYIRLVRLDTANLAATVTLKDMLVYSQAGTSKTKLIEFVFNTSQTYVMVLSDQNIAIYQNGVYLIDIYNTDFTSGRIPNVDWLQEADTMLLLHEDVQSVRLRRNGANDVWVYGLVPWTNIPTHDFGAVSYAGTITPSAATGTVTLTASVSVFTAAMVGWVVRGNSGWARITAYTSGTVVTATVGTAFANTTAFSGATFEEPIWSATRGWPRHACFHQNRTWIDGGKSRPSIVYGSVVNLFFDFYFGTALDDEAIGPILGDQFDSIEAIYPGRSLMFFTSGSEYVAPQPLGDPLTPTNTIAARQSKLGSSSYLRPQESEGGVFYIQNGGQSVQEFVYQDTQNSFLSNQISLLSSHLVKDPVDFTLRKATSTDEGSYLLLVLADGSLTVSNILRSQGITAFTGQSTDGKFKNCISNGGDMYFVVERIINGQTVNYLEKFNNDLSTDCAKLYEISSPTDTFTGLDHLEAKECRVLADGSVMENQTPSSGSVTIERQAESTMEIGLNYTPMVRDLPVQNPQLGTLLGKKANVSEIVLELYETAHIKVNGKSLSFRGFGPSGNGSPLDQTPPRYTGQKRMVGFRGWDSTGQLTITQDDPAPMTVLAIVKRVRL